MDTDTLLAQALALVNEDRRGELADIIERIITAAQAMPPKVHILAVDATDVMGVYVSEDALVADARRFGLKRFSRGEFVVKEAAHE